MKKYLTIFKFNQFDYNINIDIALPDIKNFYNNLSAENINYLVENFLNNKLEIIDNYLLQNSSEFSSITFKRSTIEILGSFRSLNKKHTRRTAILGKATYLNIHLGKSISKFIGNNVENSITDKIDFNILNQYLKQKKNSYSLYNYITLKIKEIKDRN